MGERRKGEVMSADTHTPGPWRITNAGLNDDGCYRHQIGTHEKTVAYTWLPNEHNDAENEANALVIRAAPELLAALGGLVKIIGAAGLSNLSNGVQLGPTSWLVKANYAMETARAAIAAAKPGGGP